MLYAIKIKRRKKKGFLSLPEGFLICDVNPIYVCPCLCIDLCKHTDVRLLILLIDRKIVSQCAAVSHLPVLQISTIIYQVFSHCLLVIINSMHQKYMANRRLVTCTFIKVYQNMYVYDYFRHMSTIFSNHLTEIFHIQKEKHNDNVKI